MKNHILTEKQDFWDKTKIILVPHPPKMIVLRQNENLNPVKNHAPYSVVVGYIVPQSIRNTMIGRKMCHPYRRNASLSLIHI